MQHLKPSEEWIRSSRAARLEGIGELAVYLASDLAAFVTGQTIAIDGGRSAR